MGDLSIEERFKKAISIRNEGELRKAIPEFQEIIDLYPSHPKIGGVLSVLAGIYQDLGEYNSAKLYFKKASELNPKSEIASLGLYLSCVKLLEYDEAIKELERYLSEYPADRYKVTLTELLGDLEQGYIADFKEIILRLAQKHDVRLGEG